MSDWKSKLPDLQEVWSMTVKLAKDMKTSVGEIVDEYKKKHPSEPVPEKTKKEPEQAESPQAESPQVESPQTDEKKK